MGAAAAIIDGRIPAVQAPITAPLRNLCLTFALTVVSLGAAGALAGTKGYEMLIVGMGWPHVILGFLFYFGRVLRGELRARSYFLMLALLTLILWSAHYSFTITGFISIYFTYHVFRDEVFIYFQTRARHKLRGAVQIAGLLPFILLMFFITDPRPQYYRQSLRSGELSAATATNNGWTLIGFQPVSYSRGKDFYFYLETPGVKGTQGLALLASQHDTRADGEMRVGDRKWTTKSDLIYEPYYADGAVSTPGEPRNLDGVTPVRISGDYRLGQTFKATRDNLAGIWISTSRFDDAPHPTKISFHLTPDTSLPLPPLTPTLKLLRLVLIVLLAGLVLWKAVPNLKKDHAFWLYFLFFLAVLAIFQKVIKAGAGTGLEFPVMFQVIVVFHYWSWYVFSFNKLLAMPSVPISPPKHAPAYDRLLVYLGSIPHFAGFVIILNLVTFAAVGWYSELNGPAALRYLFDYNYFLYFLVFHVTFSFAPRRSSPKATPQVQPAVAGATA